MGLIVNRPVPDLSFEDLLDQLGLELGSGQPPIRVHFGGPVEVSRGFVLHSTDYGGQGATLQVDDRFGMTATVDVLQDIARGAGPGVSLLALGYAGWGPGQLESEILRNGWLTCAASRDLVFDAPDEAKWARALATLGVDPVTLSPSAGHA